ncbi:MAG TPA: hypothetical protein VMW16_05325 [Sedimentisphaerales bacterium]|nr:hypothetical protein [Sedimentisphaerales bacterium]
MLFSFPGALVFGVRGIINDRRKMLAVGTTIIAAAFVLFFFLFIVAKSVRW